MVDFVKLLLDQNENTAGQYTPINEIKADERAVGPYTGEQGQPVVAGGYTLAPVPKRKPDIAIMNAQEEEPVAEVKPAAPAAPSPVQNLKNAEQELQEAREADAKSGSEGYEAKENGVFSRIRQFGDGIAYAGSLVEKTLKDIAQSPISNFIDPTTLLGGRQTMVRDLDKHFATRGIPGLKNDLLAQQKLNTELEKTPVGQFQTYEGWSPERQAAYRQFRADTKGSTGTQGGYKSLAAAVMDLPRAASEYYGHEATPEEQQQYWNMMYPNIPLNDAVNKLTRTGVGAGTPTNVKAYVIGEGKRRYAEKPEMYPNGETQAMNEVWGELPPEMRRTAYQSQNPQEKQAAKQLETASKEYAEMTAKEFAEFGSNYDKTLRGLQVLKKALEDPNNETMFGGWFNSTIQRAASELGYKTKNEQEALAVFNNAMRSMHGEAARQIDPSGRLTDAEQRRIDSTIIDMNQGVDYNRRMVEDTLARMALGKVAAEEKFAMVYSGAGPREVSDFLNRKYYYTRLYPEQYIDPNTIEQHKFDRGQFVWSNKANDWLFDKEVE